MGWPGPINGLRAGALSIKGTVGLLFSRSFYYDKIIKQKYQSPKVGSHAISYLLFEDLKGVQIAWVSGPWFLSIFMNMLPWESVNLSVLRVWDVLLFQGNRVMLFRTALALMELYGPALVTTKDAGDAVTLLQSLAGLTFDSIQLVLPLAWALASKLYGFKENKSTNGGLSRMDSESSTAAAAPKCCLSNVLVLKEVSHYCLGTRLICAVSVYFMLLMQDLMLPVVISYINAAIDTTAIGFKRRSPGCIFTLTSIAKWECSSYGRALALHARGTGVNTAEGIYTADKD
ncbi:Rab-GTPase-TBC domain-containing protein [Tanacetum coccineum]